MEKNWTLNNWFKKFIYVLGWIQFVSLCLFLFFVVIGVIMAVIKNIVA